MRCLIVDDSADFVDAARGLLECEGLSVVGVASTGAEALSVCSRKYGPTSRWSTSTSAGESGFELAEQLHRVGWSTPSPVILISTHAAQDFADMIETSPAAGFLSKSALTGAAIRDLVGGSASVEEGDHR